MFAWFALNLVHQARHVLCTTACQIVILMVQHVIKCVRVVWFIAHKGPLGCLFLQ